MVTGDLIRHKVDNDSFGVVIKVDMTEIKVLWLDQDYPVVEWYSKSELAVTSSADLD